MVSFQSWQGRTISNRREAGRRFGIATTTDQTKAKVAEMNHAIEKPPFPNLLPLTISDAKNLASGLLKENPDLSLAVDAIRSQDALGVLVLMSALRERINELRSSNNE